VGDRAAVKSKVLVPKSERTSSSGPGGEEFDILDLGYWYGKKDEGSLCGCCETLDCDWMNMNRDFQGETING
jgi:hypothetical protein